MTAPALRQAFGSRLTERTPPETIRLALESLPPNNWPEGWHNWPAVKAVMAAVFREFADSVRQPDAVGEGRGIVTMGGGVKYFTSAYVQIRRLRELGCTLPVELWHLGVNEMGPAMRRLVEPLGVRVVDAVAMERAFPWRVMGGWQCKPFSVLYSSFAEVLWLDADSVPAHNPDAVFNDPNYQKTGAVFFPDYDTWHLHADTWRAFGLAPPDNGQPLYPREDVGKFYGAEIPEGHATPIESGQFWLDKRRVWRELRLAGFLAEFSDYTFWHVHGDKECFRLAWHLLGTPYSMPKRFPGWNTHTMIQYGFSGQPMFYHRTLDKLRLDGKNRISGIPGEQRYFVLCDELASKWCGRPWGNEHPTFIEAAVAEALGGKTVIYDRVGRDRRGMALLKTHKGGGKIGRGSARLERDWSVFEDGGRVLLAVTGDGGALTFAAAADEGGTFRGRWVVHEKMQVEITPTDEPAEATVADVVPDVSLLTQNADLRAAIEAAATADLIINRPPVENNDKPRLAIIMPVVLQVRALLDMTYKAVGLIKTRADAKLYVKCNRLRNLDGLTAETLRVALRSLCGLEVTVSVADRSVAASWNEGVRDGIKGGADLLLIMANDVFLKPDTIDTLLDARGHLPTNCVMWSGTDRESGAVRWDVAEGCDFNLAMFTPSTVARHGWFDETYKPAYFEDNDMHARVALAGDTMQVVKCATFDHQGSATVRGDPEMAHHRDHWWEHNKGYFASKWGAKEPVNKEDEMRRHYHKRPFNDPSKPLWWWDGSPQPPLIRKA